MMPDAIAAALARGAEVRQAGADRLPTIIGFGAPNKAGHAKAHGEALGRRGSRGARKETLGWHYGAVRRFPTTFSTSWREAGSAARPSARRMGQRAWRRCRPQARRIRAPHAAASVPAALATALGALKEKLLAEKPQHVATRKASEMALEVINAGDAGTRSAARPTSRLEQHQDQEHRRRSRRATTPGRYIHYGIREHGMAAAMNGMALHGGIIPVWRHLPGVLRLLPPRDPPRRADGHARHLCDDA